jgi:cytochrome c oxidase cbb3-type subunit 1
MILLLLSILALVFCTALILAARVKRLLQRRHPAHPESQFKTYLENLEAEQLKQILRYKRSSRSVFLLGPLLLIGFSGFAQQAPSTKSLFSEGGIIITIILIMIPVLAMIALMILNLSRLVRKQQRRQELGEAAAFAEYLKHLDDDATLQALAQREQALDFSLSNQELSGKAVPADTKGLINQVHTEFQLPVVPTKKRALKRPNIDPQLTKLVLWYFVCAAFWLLFGTTIGEYVGIKFVAPDADHISWLSFGRLRPVHTNAVFWGWASLGMLGLGYYIVPMVCNTPLASYRKGWYALILVNAAVVFGTLCLMAGINNGGGEYREYIWPVMALFGLGLIFTLINFLQTIARRTTKEIYISNWYIVSAIMFALTIAFVAYFPYWQNGLGETIIQGYYMHQGVGMWFMLFTLGIVYYMLPQQLNRPIYSYSLGILAFWTQILFYTLIGTHHFVFSSIPWWLQTVAIVGSMGMVIPVIAGTTNFILTFKGSWHKLGGSYTLPFFLVGIIFYCTGSLQGTAEAFRSTNLIWHFTDFTVAHSHLTMYGIICFFLWAGMYAVVPRLTGQEAPQLAMGAHFWLALIGLLFYTVPLMIGSTLRGQLWLQQKPFIDTVVHMAPYWLWRAIGGSLMWLSHLFFAYNLYRMLARERNVDVKQLAIQQLEAAV